MGNPESVENKRKLEFPLSGVVGLVFLALIIWNVGIANYNKARGIDPQRQPSVAGDFEEDFSGATGSGNNETTITIDSNMVSSMGADGFVTLPNGQRGKIYPPNLIFYPLVPSPPDLPDYICFGIPDVSQQPLDPSIKESDLEVERDATTWGSFAIAGLDSRLLNDVYRYGIFYKNGVKYVIDLQTDPKGWSGLWLVKKGDFGCTRAN